MIENNDDARFLYTVCPKKPIKNLNESISLIRISKSLYLTKEEVIKCLDCGSVYRRFSNEGINEKTNKYDVDRVHRENYISKADWALMQNNAADTNNLKVNGVAEAPKPEKKEEKIIIEEQPKVEEVVTPEEKVEVATSGYVATEEDAVVEVESETVTNVPEDAELIIIDAKTTEIEDISKDTAETINNDKIADDTIVEAVDIEAVEDESENITEDSTENTSNNNIVVNYNGKKKKHH